MVTWKDKQTPSLQTSPPSFFFPMQILDVPTRNEALLDLLLANQESVLCNISLRDSLGCADYSIVEFGILLGTLKVSTKI